MADIAPGLEPVAQFFREGIPFNRFLGLQVDLLRPGRCVLRLPFRPELIGDPTRPALHGGVISMLLDTAGGGACFASIDIARQKVATVDLRVDYLRPGPSADLVCDAHLVRMGNRVAVARMELFSARLPAEGEPREPFATGQGVYNVLGRKGS